VAWAPFRAEDADTLRACRAAGAAANVVEGVDDAVVGEIVSRATLAAVRRLGLADGPRVLRLTEPLQRRVWDLVVRDVETPLRTADIARKLRVSREHLSRQFGAGGAPNLKRVIDLTRIACAAQLLRNPRMPPTVVSAVLNFASAGHLTLTARRIANASVAELGALGPEGVLAGFVKGRTRSRRLDP
jgi:AraC-like DNA-binding protein